MRIVNYICDLLSLFKNGNRFLVVEILNHQTKATFIKADFEKRTFHILKTLNGESVENLLPKFGKLKNYHIVLNLDPKFATTLYTSVSVVRDNSKEPIDDGDLDNLISRAIWSFFDRQRSKVAKKMSISDLDVILSDVQINGIKLDGHKVVNPLGFQAKAVEINLSLTFTPREFINNLKKLLPKENIIFVGEDGPALSHLLAQSHGEGSFLLANIFPEQTTLFSVDGQAISYLDKFDWGQTHLLKSLSEYLGTGDSTTSAIMERYICGEASPYFIKKTENFLLNELKVFVNGLEMAAKRADSRHIYLHPFFKMPPVILSSAFKNRFSQTMRLAAVTNNIIGEKFNHELKLKKGQEVSNTVATLAGVLLSSVSSSNDKVSKIAKRRIRWLT